MNLREALVAGKAGGACVTGVLVGESVAFLQLFLDASAPITAAISRPEYWSIIGQFYYTLVAF